MRTVHHLNIPVSRYVLVDKDGNQRREEQRQYSQALELATRSVPEEGIIELNYTLHTATVVRSVPYDEDDGAL
jgi:hypothetical protein